MSRIRVNRSKAAQPVTKTSTGHPKLQFWLCCALIIAIGFVVYIPAISNGFIWDDDVMLTDNTVMKASDGLQRIWFSTELSDYFPLTSTSFWIEWRLWGMNAIGYNVTNILLHTIAGILFWRVLVRLKVPGAWLAALLFTVHPVCVASVDWIAERKNTLSMVFYMAATLFYLRFEQTERKRSYWLALAMFLLALLSKTSVVVLPLILLLCAWWQRNKITRLDFRRAIPFFGLALLMGLLTVWFQLHEVLLGEAKETDNILTRLIGGSWSLWFYAGKVLWPTNLSMIYNHWEIDPAKWFSYLPALLWLTMLGIFWRFRASWGRPFFFTFGYFTIALLPVLGFFDMDFLRFSQVADHLQYIAVPGLVALVIGLGAVLAKKIKLQPATHKMAFGIIACTVLLTSSILTFRQSSVYVDEETLWRDTIKKSPKAWIGYHNLADRLAELHRYAEAAEYYQEALRLKPDYAMSHNNFGNCLHILGRFDEAVDEFLDAIQSKPELAEAHNNLGVALYRKREYGKALESFRKAIQLKPDYAGAYCQAGNSAFQLGDLNSALDYYFSAARYNPDASDVQYNIGIVLSVRGETNAAIGYLKNALRLNPANDLAKRELGTLIASTDANR